VDIAENSSSAKLIMVLVHDPFEVMQKDAVLLFAAINGLSTTKSSRKLGDTMHLCST
jgi:hypothetical protein